MKLYRLGKKGTDKRVDPVTLLPCHPVTLLLCHFFRHFLLLSSAFDPLAEEGVIDFVFSF